MRESQSNSPSSLLLDLDGPGPLHARLAGALRSAIRDGRLRPDSALPPSRVLAAELGCSRWVVTQAYAELAIAGYLETRTGSGTWVRPLDGRSGQAGPAPLPASRASASRAPARRAPASRAPTARVPTVREPGIDMAPGLPDLRLFPVARWAAAIRSAAAGLTTADLGYPDPAGHRVLREAVAEYLARVRGADLGPGDLTICGSATDGIARICRALAREGSPAVAVEDPGWQRVREVAAAAGLEVIAIPVDHEGLRADLLTGTRDIGAVILTPAHHFPSGVVLSPARRLALLDWARHTGALVVEDDYDAEFRYDRRAVATLQGAAPRSVALIGSVSKTLSPAVGIGWIVSPPRWTPLLREAAPPPVLDQLAFASFLRAGSYDRHLRSARKRYSDRRDAVVREITHRLPRARVSGARAGLHLVVGFGGDLDCDAVRGHARTLGVRVVSLSRYQVHGGEPGLVIGYGNLADHEVGAAVASLAAAVARAGGLA
jgi:GntR family transcriptional regulator/MocR family aminotransferase